MNAHVFECYEEQSDYRQFSKTREALEGDVKKNLKVTEEMATLLTKEMEEPSLKNPLGPEPRL